MILWYKSYFFREKEKSKVICLQGTNQNWKWDWRTYGMADNPPLLEDGQKLMTVLSLCTFLLASLMIICILLPFTWGSFCFEKLEDFLWNKYFLVPMYVFGYLHIPPQNPSFPFCSPSPAVPGLWAGWHTVQREMWGIPGESGFYRTAGQSSLLTTDCTMLVEGITPLALLEISSNYSSKSWCCSIFKEKQPRNAFHLRC